MTLLCTFRFRDSCFLSPTLGPRMIEGWPQAPDARECGATTATLRTKGGTQRFSSTMDRQSPAPCAAEAAAQGAQGCGADRVAGAE